MRYRVLHLERGLSKWRVRDEFDDRDKAVAFCTRLRKAIKEGDFAAGRLKIKPLRKTRKCRETQRRAK